MRILGQVRQEPTLVVVGAGSMLCIVEVLVKNSVLGDTMAQMRTWLDRMGYAPVMFRLGHARRGAVFRVEFAAAAQADAFALAFDGRLLAAPPDRSVVQRDY